jgi:UDP-2-acetamido-3-amino-2,3-dideoxy-glucuronate N-acetyltransferase
MQYFAHKTSFIDQPASIGVGTKIWHFCHICRGATIGDDCSIGQNCYISGRAVIGNGCRLQNNVSVYDLVTLEDHVFCGPSVVFTNDLNPRAAYPKRGKWIPTLVRAGASLGANCTILCGITIGKHAMVAAGAVVTKNVPDYAVVTGVPARVTGWMCECGGTLKFNKTNMTQCPLCRRRYKRLSNAVKPEK